MRSLLAAFEHEAALYLRPAAVTATGLGVMALLISLLGWVRAVTPPDLFALYQPFMPLWGAWLTASVFGELADEGGATEYLLRPTATWVKVASKLAVSLLGYWIVATVIFALASAVGAGLYLLVRDGAEVPLTATIRAASAGVVARTAAATLWEYLHLHAAAFFGAVYFRSRGAAGKTLLSLAIVGLSLTVIWAAAARVILSSILTEIDSIQGIEALLRAVRDALPVQFRNPVPLLHGVRLLGTLALYGLSVLRLRETEVIG